ncbi:PREDICTED: venom protease-like isoform X2 [Nicrophorus vespilloides]|uniref:Venom protease-like isoform X2 n=1 Tax=Nicrophorus vespilloides TaxID=110193 RepID=A0ABM1N9D4_NICVS|nr:PREDICTED: venom protease-like isoform X2 [Nicrophorus vespilloides]
MFILNLSAVLIFVAICSKATLEWGENCELENGSIGVCIEAAKCQQAYRSIKLGIGNKPKLCEYKGKDTTVCCDDGNVTEITGVRSVQACKKWGPILHLPPVRSIIGGSVQPSSTAEFPHMAALGYEDTEKNETYWGCGGSLISLKFVLTAAHCLHTMQFGPIKYVRLGDLNLRATNDDADPQDFLVSKTYGHPLYRSRVKYHDIALIELNRPAVITNSFTATGWGLLSFHGNAADHLQKSFLRYVNNTECRKSYDVNSRLLSEGVQEKYQICAGFETKDSCQGDSGGPLQSLTELGNYYIHGVTSFGKACLLTNSPVVYTRVANYIDWIEPIVWPNTK